MLKRIWRNLRIVDQIQKAKRALASRDLLPIKHRETGSKNRFKLPRSGARSTL
jgi:hypothetical protein